MGLSLEFQEIWVQISSSGTSLVAQWLRIRLAMQGTQVRSLFGELRSHVPGQLSLPTAATEPTCPGAQAQVESPCPKAEDHTDSTRTPHAASKNWGSQRNDYFFLKISNSFLQHAVGCSISHNFHCSLLSGPSCLPFLAGGSILPPCCCHPWLQDSLQPMNCEWKMHMSFPSGRM